MKVKGVAVKSIQEFVKNRFSQNFQEWLNEMPETSRAIMGNPVYASDWYPVNEAAIEPTVAMGKLFFNGDTHKAAWESGRYSAEVALGGIYKIFVKISTPRFIIDRASKILPTYYEPSEVSVVESRPKHVTLRLLGMACSNKVIESRIEGWTQKAFEVTGCKNVRVNTLKSLVNGDSETLLKAEWD